MKIFLDKLLQKFLKFAGKTMFFFNKIISIFIKCLLIVWSLVVLLFLGLLSFFMILIFKIQYYFRNKKTKTSKYKDIDAEVIVEATEIKTSSSKKTTKNKKQNKKHFDTIDRDLKVQDANYSTKKKKDK